MKYLSINDNKVDFSLEKGDTIESVVDKVASFSREMNEYPCRLVIDNQEYSIGHHEWRAMALSDIHKIDIYTFSPATLRAYLSKLSETSYLLQSGKQKEALEMIVTLSTLMSNMIAIVPLLPHEHSKELRDQITALNGDFEELHQSIAHKDFVLVSDLIEYEICAKLDKLLQTIDS